MNFAESLAVLHGDYGWIDRLIEAVESQAPTVADKLKERKPELERVGAGAFAAIVSLVSLDRPAEAALLFLREAATPAEREAALDQAFAVSRAAEASRAEAWVGIKSLALDLLTVGKIAVPLILAAM